MSTLALPQKRTNVRINLTLKQKLGWWWLRLSSLVPARWSVRKATDLFATPFPGTRGRALRADLDGVRLETLRSGELDLQLYFFGDPRLQPYVLCAHGWSSFGLRFRGWVQALRERGLAVVCFDMPGHGRSGGQHVTLPHFTRAVLAVGAHLGAAAAAIGHSLGAAAIAQAAARGFQAQRLLLLAPAADPRAALERFARHLKLGPAAAGAIQAEFERRLGEPMTDYNAEAAAAKLRKPMLIVHDLTDRDVPWSEGERFALAVEGARLMTVAGLGHHKVVDAPEVLEAGLAFLGGDPGIGEHLQEAGTLRAR